MLTEVKAYSSWHSAPTLLLDEDGRAENDLLQVRNIDGLDPVTATANTIPLGAIDGVSYIGGNVPARNIVLTIGFNPDWDGWTYRSLRALVYGYFMPKRPSRLVFYSDDMIPVEISGIVESVTVNQFSKDPELIVSIICPDPYFTALEPTIVNGQSVRPDGDSESIEYNGSVGTGMTVKVSHVSGDEPTYIGIRIGDPIVTYFTVETNVDADNFFEMSSVPMRKYVQNINIVDGVITNLLSKAELEEGASWPVFYPTEEIFAVITDQGIQDWELTYYERFGGL